MISRDSLIRIGRYNKPHGVNGELSATTAVGPDVLTRFSCLVSEIDGIFVPFFVSSTRPKSDQTALLTIDGIGTDRQAAMLVNHDIYVKADEYRENVADGEDDQYPLDYFIGFTVGDIDGNTVGTIIDVDESTINYLFVVDCGNGDKIQLPAADELIDDIDLDAKSIVMDLPEGILTL